VNQIPRVLGRVGIEAESEFVCRDLAENDSTGFPEFAYDRAVLVRNIVLANARTGRGPDALCVEDILDRDRDAMQRSPALARCDLLVRDARGLKRIVV
jgi:hypothetical protein